MIGTDRSDVAEHEVEEHDVGTDAAGRLEDRLVRSDVRDLDVQAFAAEAPGETVGQECVVLDDQHRVGTRVRSRQRLPTDIITPCVAVRRPRASRIGDLGIPSIDE